MDMFDVKRRDHPSMDDHMDQKKPPFGGPKEKTDFEKNKRKSLNKYQRVIERNPDFEGGQENHNYDTTWKAVTRDRISRDAKKKPTDVMYAKQTIFTKAIEEGRVIRFEEFVNEELNGSDFLGQENEGENPLDQMAEPGMENDENPDLGYEVDEEQLEKVMDDFGDDLTEMIDKIVEEMEIEKDAVCDLLCAAIEKICKPEDDDETSKEDEGDGEPTDEDPKIDEQEIGG